MKNNDPFSALTDNQLWIPSSFHQDGRTFTDRELRCESAFSSGGPYYQLCMDNLPFDIFTCEDDFKAGMNMLAVSLVDVPVVVYNVILMNNHGHLILEGKETDCKEVFYRFKRKIILFDARRGYKRRLDEWDSKCLVITSLGQMRNELVYVSRNGYMAIKDATPTGYPWGSGDIFFNDNLRNYYSVPFNSLPARYRRKICHSHEITLPEKYRFGNGMILPVSYVDKTRTEALFNSANQYFSMLERHAEADVEIARRINEIIVVPDDEMFSTVCSWSNAKYRKSIRELSMPERFELAKRMKYTTASPNVQISRVLGLKKSDVDSMFPIPK